MQSTAPLSCKHSLGPFIILKGLLRQSQFEADYTQTTDSSLTSKTASNSPIDMHSETRRIKVCFFLILFRRNVQTLKDHMESAAAAARLKTSLKASERSFNNPVTQPSAAHDSNRPRTTPPTHRTEGGHSPFERQYQVSVFV